MTGYSEDADGNVVLTMARDDFQALLLTIGFAVGSMRDMEAQALVFALVNRLNAGNPNFRAYTVPAPPSAGSNNPA